MAVGGPAGEWHPDVDVVRRAADDDRPPTRAKVVLIWVLLTCWLGGVVSIFGALLNPTGEGGEAILVVPLLLSAAVPVLLAPLLTRWSAARFGLALVVWCLLTGPFVVLLFAFAISAIS